MLMPIPITTEMWKNTIFKGSPLNSDAPPVDILAPTDAIFLPSLCSYDSRQTPTPSAAAAAADRLSSSSDRPDLWSEPTAFGDRAHFRVSTLPAVLSVTGVQRFDGGEYICRVDFRQSPTVYHHVQLDVIGKQQSDKCSVLFKSSSCLR